jgi:hypothetical protein
VGVESRALIVDYDVGSTLVDRDIDVRSGNYPDHRPKVMRCRPNGKKPILQSVDRWIMNATTNEVVFHENGDMFDCRRVNMRLVTKQQYVALYDLQIAEGKLAPYGLDKSDITKRGDP